MSNYSFQKGLKSPLLGIVPEELEVALRQVKLNHCGWVWEKKPSFYDMEARCNHIKSLC